MENLKQKIQADLAKSLKGDNEIARSTLRILSGAILNKEKDKRYKISKDNPNITEKELELKSQLLEEELVDVIGSEAKKRKEAASEYEKGLRPELAEKERKELEVLQKYLPEQLSEEELKTLVKEAVEKTGSSELKDMGKIMAEVMPKVKGKADGNEVSKIVKELLS